MKERYDHSRAFRADGVQPPLAVQIPHTFTACIIMTSPPALSYALNDPVYLYSSLVLFACILIDRLCPEWMIQPLYQDMICLRFQEYGAERSSHIIFNSYPQRHQIKLVFFVDLHHFICKHLILPGGVFMAEMIVKCLSCNLQSLADVSSRNSLSSSSSRFFFSSSLIRLFAA